MAAVAKNSITARHCTSNAKGIHFELLHHVDSSGLYILVSGSMSKPLLSQDESFGKVVLGLQFATMMHLGHFSMGNLKTSVEHTVWKTYNQTQYATPKQ